jgi:hypothetical protein
MIDNLSYKLIIKLTVYIIRNGCIINYLTQRIKI